MNFQFLKRISGILFVLIILLMTGCSQSSQQIRATVTHYPEYWVARGYEDNRQVSVRVVQGQNKSEANEQTGEQFTKLAKKQLSGKQGLKVVDDDSADLLLEVAPTRLMSDYKEAGRFHDEIVYKTDIFGNLVYDENGERIPLLLAENNIFSPNNAPLFRTERKYFEQSYCEGGAEVEGVLYDNKTHEELDKFTIRRTFWSKGGKETDILPLTASAMSAIADRLYEKIMPSPIALEAKSKNLFRTAKVEMKKNGNYDITKKFKSNETTALILIALPPRANDNDFEIVFTPADTAINFPGAILQSMKIHWDSSNTQAIYEFSPSQLFETSGGVKEYDVHLVNNGKSIIHETITIKKAN